MSILAIDTTTNITSIAIIEYNGNFFIESSFSKNNHAEMFFQILNNVLKKNNYNYNKINYLTVVIGPGNFTGTKVGISAAKGISLVIKKPLYKISTLEIQAYAISLYCTNIKKNIRAIIKKNTNEFYTQLFDSNIIPLSKPNIVKFKSSILKYESLIDKKNCLTYLDCKLPNLNAYHAGILTRYKIKKTKI